MNLIDAGEACLYHENALTISCGLDNKTTFTQLGSSGYQDATGCGLDNKTTFTQLLTCTTSTSAGCGLDNKTTFTQRRLGHS
jgi:hypothetical protein